MEKLITTAEDGRNYVHYDNWVAARNVSPQWQDPRAVDVELSRPELDCASHGCPLPFWHISDGWLPVSPVIEATHPDGSESRRLLAAPADHSFGSSHGRLMFFSTFSYLLNEPWGTGVPDILAYFQGSVWRVSWLEFRGPWEARLMHYPVIDFPVLSERGIGHWPQTPWRVYEGEFDISMKPYVDDLRNNPREWLSYMAGADYIADTHGDPSLADYVAKAMKGKKTLLGMLGRPSKRMLYHMATAAPCARTFVFEAVYNICAARTSSRSPLGFAPSLRVLDRAAPIIGAPYEDDRVSPPLYP